MVVVVVVIRAVGCVCVVLDAVVVRRGGTIGYK